jgi:Raf kinase inhibitor-like YbhB/YbcL family protein
LGYDRCVIQEAVILLAVLAGSLQLQAAGVNPGGAIPTADMAKDCGGQNRMPALHWSDAPSATKSFAVVMHDRDAPIAGGFFHWVAYDIPASAHSLGGNDSLAVGVRTGINSEGQSAYYGPCPPPGPAHHYTLTLYALDVAHVGGSSPLSGAQLQQRTVGHVLAQATIAATAATNR